MSNLAAYIAQLPDGLDSYPQALSKGAFARGKLQRLPELAKMDDLPPELLELCRRPPPSSAWYPSVHMYALNALILDHLGSMEAFRAFTRQQNVDMLSGPLYRAMFHFVSPARIARSAPERFARFHKETTLRVEVEGEAAFCDLEYFPHLMSEMQVTVLADAFVVAMELAGWRAPTIEIETCTPTHARYRVFADEVSEIATER